VKTIEAVLPAAAEERLRKPLQGLEVALLSRTGEKPETGMLTMHVHVVNLKNRHQRKNERKQI
jgi:hypothetical protein